MSTAEFGDPNLGQVPAPAPAPVVAPLTVPPLEPHPAPVAVEPVVPAAPVAPVPAPAATPIVPVADMKDVPLGTLIFRAGLLTEEQLEEALQDGMKRGKRLGEVLLERGLVSEGDLGRLLAGQKGLQFVELDSAAIDPAAVGLLSVEKARLHSVLPIAFQDGLPIVAVADPSNDLVIENVRRALNCEPYLVVAGREALHRQIELAYTGAPAPEPAPVAVPEPAPVAPAPVAPVAPLTPAAEAVLPVAPPAPVETPAAPAAEGLWLGTPEPVAQPEPVAVQPQPVAVEPPPLVVQPEPLVAQPEPLLVQPEPAPLTVEPVAPAPAVTPPAAPAPVALAYAPVEPAAPAVVEEAPPPVVEPAPAPEPVAPVVSAEPVPAVEPLAPARPAEPAATEADGDEVVTWSVVLRLVDGDRLPIGTFHSNGEAQEFARGVIRQLASGEGWPFFEGRFLRPDSIVSLDLSAPEGRWLGSAARRQAWQSESQS